MSFTRTEKIGDSPALLLTDEMLKLLDIGCDDEVEVSAGKDRSLIVRSLSEWLRK